MKKLLVIVVVFLSGCAANTVNMPSPLRATQNPAALGNFSDMGIVLYASEAIDSYEQGALTNEILALTGGGSIAALGTAAVAAPAQAKGFLLGANGILMLLNLWRPVERSGADNQGAGMIREALGGYLQAIIVEGYCTVPVNRVTTSGANLFAQTNAAIKVVADLRQGILQLGSQSVKILQAAQEQPISRFAAVPDTCK